MIILHRQVASPPIKIKSGFFLFPVYHLLLQGKLLCKWVDVKLFNHGPNWIEGMRKFK